MAFPKYLPHLLSILCVLSYMLVFYVSSKLSVCLLSFTSSDDSNHLCVNLTFP